MELDRTFEKRRYYPTRQYLQENFLWINLFLKEHQRTLQIVSVFVSFSMNFQRCYLDLQGPSTTDFNSLDLCNAWRSDRSVGTSSIRRFQGETRQWGKQPCATPQKNKNKVG